MRSLVIALVIACGAPAKQVTEPRYPLLCGHSSKAIRSWDTDAVALVAQLGGKIDRDAYGRVFKVDLHESA